MGKIEKKFFKETISVQFKTVAYVVVNKIKRNGYFANAGINKMVVIYKSKLFNFTFLLENCFMDLLTKICLNLHHKFFGFGNYFSLSRRL